MKCRRCHAGAGMGGSVDDGSWRSLLDAHPGAVVAAIDAKGRMTAVPDSIPVGSHPRFERASGFDLVDPRDQPVVIAAWTRAQVEPVVQLEARLLGDADGAVSTLLFVDLRADHGVHLVIADARDPARVLAAADEVGARGRHIGHVERDAVGVFLDVDDAMTALVGWTRDELVGRRTLEFVHPDDMEQAIESWFAMRAGSAGRTRVRFRHAAGHYLWLEVTNRNLLDDPDVGRVRAEVVDISREMAELEALHASERLLQRLAGALPIGICHLRPDGEVVYSNPPFAQLLGSPATIEDLADRFAGADRRFVELAVEAALAGRESDLEVGVLHGFEERRCELTLRAMRNDGGDVDGVIVCTTDVTERSRLRAELEHRATHDALSGCLNRAATVAALERCLREHPRVAVAYVDLDRFKGINDDLGHAAGDEVLRIVAARLRGATRAGDVVGRIGGDEFVVISPQADGAFDVRAFAARLTASVCGDVRFARARIPVRASTGAVVSVAGDVDAEALLGRADAAMYDAKRRARRRSGVLAVLPAPGTR